MQYLQIVNEVLQIIGDTLPSITIKTFVNRAIKELSGKVVLDSNIAETLITLTTGTQSYALPSDFGREVLVKQEKLNVLDKERWYMFAQHDRASVSVTLSSYAIAGTSIYFYPLASLITVASTSQVLFVYIKEPADLDDDSDVPVVPRNYHYVIKELALLYALRAIPPVLDPNGRFASMIPGTKDAYETGLTEMKAAETYKGRMDITTR